MLQPNRRLGGRASESLGSLVTDFAILDKNMEIYSPTPEEMAKFKAAVIPVADWLKEEIGAKYVEDFIKRSKKPKLHWDTNRFFQRNVRAGFNQGACTLTNTAEDKMSALDTSFTLSRKISDIVERASICITVFYIAAVFCVVFLGVIMRVIGSTFSWSEEISRWLLVGITYKEPALH